MRRQAPFVRAEQTFNLSSTAPDTPVHISWLQTGTNKSDTETCGRNFPNYKWTQSRKAWQVMNYGSIQLRHSKIVLDRLFGGDFISRVVRQFRLSNCVISLYSNKSIYLCVNRYSKQSKVSLWVPKINGQTLRNSLWVKRQVWANYWLNYNYC